MNDDDKSGPADSNKYSIDKIKMGDISGPCGNANCSLAHQIKTYIRNQDIYKQGTGGTISVKEGSKGTKVCGKCQCKDDRWHRDGCPEIDKKPICSECGGIAQAGETCADRLKKLYGTGVTPKGSETS